MGICETVQPYQLPYRLLQGDSTIEPGRSCTSTVSVSENTPRCSKHHRPGPRSSPRQPRRPILSLVPNTVVRWNCQKTCMTISDLYQMGRRAPPVRVRDRPRLQIVLQATAGNENRLIQGEHIVDRRIAHGGMKPAAAATDGGRDRRLVHGTGLQLRRATGRGYRLSLCRRCAACNRASVVGFNYCNG